MKSQCGAHQLQLPSKFIRHHCLTVGLQDGDLCQMDSKTPQPVSAHDIKGTSHQRLPCVFKFRSFGRLFGLVVLQWQGCNLTATAVQAQPAPNWIMLKHPFVWVGLFVLLLVGVWQLACWPNHPHSGRSSVKAVTAKWLTLTSTVIFTYSRLISTRKHPVLSCKPTQSMACLALSSIKPPCQTHWAGCTWRLLKHEASWSPWKPWQLWQPWQPWLWCWGLWKRILHGLQITGRTHTHTHMQPNRSTNPACRKKAEGMTGIRFAHLVEHGCLKLHCELQNIPNAVNLTKCLRILGLLVAVSYK